MPAINPSVDLAGNEPGWPAEAGQSLGRHIDGVKGGKGVDERFADASSHVLASGHGRRFFVADDESASALHDVEDRAGHCEILAEQQRRGCERERLVHCPEPPRSRAMSCARGGTGPSGGRRNTISASSKRSR